MAERQTARRPKKADELEPDNGELDADAQDTGSASRAQGRRSRDDDLTAAQAAQRGLRQISELTGKQTEGVTGVEPAEDGWIVGVEVVEDRRVPSSTDLLGTYEAELDLGGDLLSYRRVRRYTRGRGDNSEDT
jgi:hypothetical protein